MTTQVSTALLADGAVTTPKLGANQVTPAKLARYATAGGILVAGGAGADPYWLATAQFSSYVAAFYTAADSKMRVVDNGGAVALIASDDSVSTFRSIWMQGNDVKLYANGVLAFDVTQTLVSSAVVYSATSATAANIAIDAGGQIRRSTSSRKYKTQIADYTRGLAAALALRPVSYKSKADPDGPLYAGLIAEEVHDAGLAEFVAYGADGTPEGLHYPHMVALLLTSIRELAARVAALEAAP